MKIRRLILSTALASTVSAASLLSMHSAAQTFDSARGYYESGVQMLASDDLAAAAIQFKNALQIDSDHVPSLLELGQTQYKLGEVAEAMQLLEEALVLGADPRIAAEPLARCYLQLGEFARLRQRLPLDQLPPDNSVLRAAHVQALIAQERLTEASVLLEKSLINSSDSLDLRLAKLTLQLREGRFNDALALSEALTSEHGQDSRSWNAYASALHTHGRLREAQDAYETAISLNEFNADARIALISLLLDSEQEAAATENIRWMRENIPADPRAAYFDALIAARRGDSSAEAKALDEAIASFDAYGDERLATDPQLLMIAALSYHGRGAFETARDLLRSYLSGHRGDVGAARLLGNTLLSLNEYDEAVSLLAPYNRRNPSDVDTAILLASALNAASKPLQAAELLERVPGAGFGTEYVDGQLAATLIDSGDTERGVALLAEVYSQRTLSESEMLKLALAYMRDENWSAALAVLSDAPNPSSPLIRNVKAIGLVGAGESDAAIRELKDILKSDEDFLPAWGNLARLQREAGDLDESERSLMKALNSAPEEPRLQFELALTQLARGDLAEALRHAERASESAPRDMQYAALEIDLQFALNNSRAALDAALRAATIEDAPAGMQRLLASTQARAGSRDQALITLQRAARNADFDAAELVEIAGLQLALGAYETAAGTLDKALKGNPDFMPAKRYRIQALIGSGSISEAESEAQQLARNLPEDADSYLLLGEARMAAGKPDSALEAFTRCENLNGGDMCIIGQVDALEASGKIKSVVSRLTDYYHAEGSNPILLGHYADLLIASSDWSGAHRVLKDLYEVFPDRAAIVNNLALTQYHLGDGQALSTAELAHSLDSDNPMINDTFGWLLLNAGRADEALGYLREASARASENSEIRFHLAAALAALDRTAEAERELTRALDATTNAPWLSEAETLRRSLNAAQN